MRGWKVAVALVGSLPLSSAVDLNVTDRASVLNATSTVAWGLMKYYTGNITNTESTIGVLPPPHYWWQGGALWGAMLDYYHFTNDSIYNSVITQALLSQVGPDYDYMVPSHQKDEGNDDQAFWGFATMSAAERDYPQPTIGNYSWLQLTERLWNTQVRRWDLTSCGGGLKWQIFPFNAGYDYKNSVSNGAFFQLAARLALFTGNQTYVDWALKSFNWALSIGLINNYHVFDGSDDLINCTEQDRTLWSYNEGIYLYGAAVMYNYTNGSAQWTQHVQGFLNASANFVSPFDNATGIVYEPQCEPDNTCNTDQLSFKAYLSRFMWATTILAPFTSTAITRVLTASGQAAAQACSGLYNGDSHACGQKWYVGAVDGSFGVGQQMSALEVIQGLLIKDSAPPLHADTVRLKPAETASTATIPLATQGVSPFPTPRGDARRLSTVGKAWMSIMVMGGIAFSSFRFVELSWP